MYTPELKLINDKLTGKSWESSFISSDSDSDSDSSELSWLTSEANDGNDPPADEILLESYSSSTNSS